MHVAGDHPDRRDRPLAGAGRPGAEDRRALSGAVAALSPRHRRDRARYAGSHRLWRAAHLAAQPGDHRRGRDHRDDRRSGRRGGGRRDRPAAGAPDRPVHRGPFHHDRAGRRRRAWPWYLAHGRYHERVLVALVRADRPGRGQGRRRPAARGSGAPVRRSWAPAGDPLSAAGGDARRTDHRNAGRRQRHTGAVAVLVPRAWRAGADPRTRRHDCPRFDQPDHALVDSDPAGNGDLRAGPDREPGRRRPALVDETV